MAEEVKEEKVVDAAELLRRLGLDLTPPKVIVLYGQPMVGKSVLSWQIARSLSGRGVALLAYEKKYRDETYFRRLTELAGNWSPHSVFICETLRDMYRALKGRDEPLNADVLIVDSISAIADKELSYWAASLPPGSFEPRVVSARIVPLLRAASSMVIDWATANKAVAIVVAHATSTAGSGKHRGVTDWKPSFATRCGHHIDYELLLEELEDKTRRLIDVADRVNEANEGSYIKFRIVQGGVVIKGKKGHIKVGA